MQKNKILRRYIHSLTARLTVYENARNVMPPTLNSSGNLAARPVKPYINVKTIKNLLIILNVIEYRIAK